MVKDNASTIEAPNSRFISHTCTFFQFPYLILPWRSFWNMNANCEPFKCQLHKIVKHTQTIRHQNPTNYLSVFDHFVGLVFKGLMRHVPNTFLNYFIFRWSYGVVLWELVTLGASPYPGMNSYEVVSFLQDGYRMDKPKHCSDELWVIPYIFFGLNCHLSPCQRRI